MSHPANRVSLGTRLWVTAGGLGLSPKAPGTAGSFGAMLLAWPIAFLGSPWLFAVAAVVLFFISIPLVDRASEQSGTHDAGWIVIDEVCGQWLAYAFLPPLLPVASPLWLLAGFALFRFFDILKPLGIKRLERLPGAWGIMADDLLGGLYAGIILAVAVRLWSL